jgi:hypothetical protein
MQEKILDIFEFFLKYLLIIIGILTIGSIIMTCI